MGRILLQTVRNALNYAKRRLGTLENCEVEARVLVGHVLGLSQSKLLKNLFMDVGSIPELDDLIDRRLLGEPLQYIIGEWEFMGILIKTSPCALIPRQDTETLAEQALLYLNERGYTSVLDMCCGTGCIGIAMALLGKANVTFCDISSDCVALAKKNAELNGVTGSFIVGDLFENIQSGFDMILINPPYINAHDMECLQQEVKHEPRLALYGGEDGLNFYRRIAKEYRRVLNTNGTLMMELGLGQSSAVGEMLGDYNIFKDVCGVDRVIATAPGMYEKI